MDLMTIEEVARVLRVRQERAYQLARDGVLPAVRVGRQVRVDRCALREWIERGGRGLNVEQRSGLR
jgi:excisionase family DNA binding protein